MKVLIFTNSLFKHIAGIDRVGLRVARAMLARGHEVVWLTPLGKSAPLERLPSAMKICFVPDGFDQAVLDALRDMIKKEEPDVVLPMLSSGKACLFPAATEGSGAYLLFSEHNDPEYYVDRWWTLGASKKERLALRDDFLNCCDGIHLLSHRYISSVPENLQNKCSIIENAVVPTQHRAEVLNEQSPRVISIGRLAYEKGFDRSIRAFASLSVDFPNWRYDIFGDGPDRRMLQALIERLRMSGRVRLRGFTDQPQLELMRSQLLLMPSRFEGWPLLAGEAQALALPLVGYRDCAAMLDMLGQNRGAVLVESGDVVAYENAVRLFLESPSLRAQCGAEGLLASKAYEPSIIDARWVEMLESSSKKHSSERLALRSSSGAVAKENLLAAVVKFEQERHRIRRTLRRSISSRLNSSARRQFHRGCSGFFEGKLGGTLFWGEKGIEIGAKHLAPVMPFESKSVLGGSQDLTRLQNLIAAHRAKVIVTESARPLPAKDGQKCIQIWHSSGFIKKAANLEKANQVLGPFDVVVCPSEAMRPVYAKAFSSPLDRVLALGSVKTDILINSEARAKRLASFERMFPELAGKKVYLWAPTFRGTWPHSVYHYSSVEIDELETLLSGDEVLFVCPHPSIAGIHGDSLYRRTNVLSQVESNRVFDGRSLCLETLLVRAEVIVSDYSGVLLDAVAARKPILCFADDIHCYDRSLADGFIDDVPNLELMPGAKSFLEGIRRSSANGARYATFREKWVGSCDGKSRARVVELISELLEAI